mmetsp:Transcript_87625/g.221065  ORF Transcript_87625/g.221065 Transcript_87625/m.221065 type:complete len:203 (-) Transcript_87625:97-705(-)
MERACKLLAASLPEADARACLRRSSSPRAKALRDCSLISVVSSMSADLCSSPRRLLLSIISIRSSNSSSSGSSSSGSSSAYKLSNLSHTGFSGESRKSFTRNLERGSSRGTFRGPLSSFDHFHFCCSRKNSFARNSAFIKRSLRAIQALFHPGTLSGTGAGLPSGVANLWPQPRFLGYVWISLINLVRAASVMTSWWNFMRL